MGQRSGFCVRKPAVLSGLLFALACSGRQSGASSSGDACEVTKKDRITEVMSPKYGYGIMLPST